MYFVGLLDLDQTTNNKLNAWMCATYNYMKF